jgi:hypothetical protein
MVTSCWLLDASCWLPLAAVFGLAMFRALPYFKFQIPDWRNIQGLGDKALFLLQRLIASSHHCFVVLPVFFR